MAIALSKDVQVGLSVVLIEFGRYPERTPERPLTRYRMITAVPLLALNVSYQAEHRNLLPRLSSGRQIVLPRAKGFSASRRRALTVVTSRMKGFHFLRR